MMYSRVNSQTNRMNNIVNRSVDLKRQQVKLPKIKLKNPSFLSEQSELLKRPSVSSVKHKLKSNRVTTDLRNQGYQIDRDYRKRSISNMQSKQGLVFYDENIRNIKGMINSNRIMYYGQRNTEEQLKLLEQLYKRSDNLVYNYLQVRNEAQLLDDRLRQLKLQ